MFDEISGIAGRDITKFEDIYRSEASIIIEAKKSGGSRNSAPPSNPAYASNRASASNGVSRNAGGSPAPSPAPNGVYEDPGFPPFEPPASDDPMYSDAYEPPSRPPAQPHANVTAQIYCADCGASITKAEQNYSANKFGRQLCRKCQTAAR